MERMHTKYKMIVVSGASGAGKTTLLHMVERDLGIPLTYLPSYMTRERRESDERGIRYVTVEQFKYMEERGEFLWTKHIHAHYKGTRREDVRDVQYASTLVATILTPDCPPLLYSALTSLGMSVDDVLFIHVEHPGEMVLRERLAARGDSPEKIQVRIDECREWDAYVRALPFPVTLFDNTGGKEALLKRLRALFVG